MKTETKTFAEYKAPKCKVVLVQCHHSILVDSLIGDSDSLEDMTPTDTSGWSWDEQ